MDILEIASQLARTMYIKEFCSICGKAITIEEAEERVSAQGNDKISCIAHKDCLQKPAAEKTLKLSHELTANG
jgi:hypothetical protein